MQVEEKQFRTTLDTLLEGVQIIGYDWKYLYVNDAAAKQGRYPKEELLGHTMMEKYTGIENTDLFRALTASMKERMPRYMENEFIYPDGSTGWFKLSIQPAAEGIIILSMDITKRKKAEEKLQSEKNLFEGLLESAPDGIAGINEKDQIILFNRQAEIIFGYERQEVIGQSLSILMPDEHVRKHQEFVAGYFAHPSHRQMGMAGRPLFGKRKNGELFPVDISLSCFQTTEGKITLSSIRDITKQKLAEEKLVKTESEIRNFATHLNKVIEEERAHLAREIHDELGQQLTGIKINISSLKKHSSPENNFEEKIAGIMKNADDTIQSLRKIATQLRPGILDTLGLIPSIQWLAEEFEKKTGIKVKYNAPLNPPMGGKNISSPDGGEPALSLSKGQEGAGALATCFFRICQESLTNISKHAGASEVTIQINYNANELILKVSDNGKGIASEKLENPFSMGLLGMRERANIIGADLKITSKKDFGTSIALKANLN